MAKLTRRTAIQTLAAPALLGAAHPKATAFALIGDRYHNSDYIRTGLGKTLTRDAGVSIDFCDDVNLLNSDNLSGYKLLIVFRDGMLWPDGYPDENSNAAWAGRRGDTKIVSEPAVPA